MNISKEFKNIDKKLKKKSGCDSCYGYGIWAVGPRVPMGPLDYKDGCPNKPCPKCGGGGR